MKKKPSKRTLIENRQRKSGQYAGSFNYQNLEPRQLLAAYFPTYINGVYTLGNGPGAATPYALEDTFELSSNPDASKIIYLDYTGHHSVDNRWGHDIMFPAFDRDGDASTFSDDELLEIQLQFQNVAEDFLPFDVNVTTKEPDIERLRKTSPDDEEYGIRSVNTQATDGFGGFGGIAYLNSFDDDIDNPVFALNKGANTGGMTNSHEVGHSLGLAHDGLGNQAYHPGANGTGPTSWGPIMGAPFGTNLTQWSNGDYANSTNTEDDYQVITKNANGFGFRPDQAGDSIADAADLQFADGSSSDVFHVGVVETRNDVDFLRFSTGEGDVSLTIKTFQERPNLDVLAKLYDADGNLIAENNPINGVDASFEETLLSGEYYISVEGTGLTGVYSDYGSVGLFIVEGTVVETVSGLPIGEVGTASVNHEWKTISFSNEFVEVPVVIAGPATRLGPDPVTVRVRNVTTTSFELRLQEWDYRDQAHSYEIVDYMAILPGEHTLGDGTLVSAGSRDDQGRRWRSYTLGELFENDPVAPVVFAQVVSDNDSSATTARVRNVENSRFQIRLEQEQANTAPRAPETINYVAIEQGIGQAGDLDYEAALTPEKVDHQPYLFNFSGAYPERPGLFAATQSYNGGDTFVIRNRGSDAFGASINLEEERSADRETSHNPETTAYLTFEFGDIYGAGIEIPPVFKSAPLPGDDARGQAALTVMQSRKDEIYPYLQHGDPLLEKYGIDHGDEDHDHDHQLDLERFWAIGNASASVLDDGQIELGQHLTGTELSRLAGSVIADSNGAVDWSVFEIDVDEGDTPSLDLDDLADSRV